MTIDLDQLEALAKAALTRGQEDCESLNDWFSREEFIVNMLLHPVDARFAEAATPRAIIELIAEVRRLHDLEEAIRHDRAMFEGTSDEDNPMGILVTRALSAIDAARDKEKV
jgi:hypothetical protein